MNEKKLYGMKKFAFVSRRTFERYF